MIANLEALAALESTVQSYTAVFQLARAGFGHGLAARSGII